MINKFSVLLFLFAASWLNAAAIMDYPFKSEQELQSWQRNNCEVVFGDGMTLELSKDKIVRGTQGISRSIPVEKIRGMRIACRVEVKAENLSCGPKPARVDGGKFMMIVKTNEKPSYHGAKIDTGTFDWREYSFTVNIPQEVQQVRLALGFQNACGKISFRKLRLEIADEMIDLSQVVNMGYRDEIAEDGKGGWSDQGPENDAGNFDYKKTSYGNVPFELLDPARNNGKSVLVLKSLKFPAGPEAVEVKVSGNGKYLYLLHTLCYGNTGKAGIMEIIGKGGEKEVFELIDGTDVADWWKLRRLSRAWPGGSWLAKNGNNVGVFVSCFELKFEPEKIVFRSVNSQQIWLILGATLSHEKYEPEVENYVIKANDTWQPLQRPETPCIIPGSALDMSLWMPQLPLDRVIVNSRGQLAFQSNPEQRVRFFCCSPCRIARVSDKRLMHENNFDSHDRIDAFIREAVRHGYNMLRFHSFNVKGMLRWRDGEFEIDEKQLDLFDYLIAKCKEKRIYLMMDLLGGNVAYMGISPWSKEGKAMQYMADVYFDEGAREHCRKGIEFVLGHVNPYTGTRLADDPIMALVTGWNEQEFAFIRKFKFAGFFPKFKVFLQNKYQDVAALNKNWKSNFDMFDSAAIFNYDLIRETTRRGADIDEFIVSQEHEMLRWYRKVLSDIGYKGLFTNYDMTKSLHYAPLRAEVDVVTMHAYQSHASNGNNKGSTMHQGSAVTSASGFFRGVAGTRIAGKPMFIDEYAQVWWNQYRYEEPFIFAAYAALHDYDGLSRYANPVYTLNANFMYPWDSYWDPVAVAVQYQTAFVFLRGDVKPSAGKIRLQFSEKAVRRSLMHRNSVDAAQDRLALIANFGLENTDNSRRPPEKNEYIIQFAGGSTVENNEDGFSQSDDKISGNFDFAATVADMKKRGYLSQDNRSGEWHLFESSTGELLLDANRKLAYINTPRFQGVCAHPGMTAQLMDVSLDKLTTKGSVSVAALDGQTVGDSKRLLLIYATNALNSEMTFEDKSMRTIVAAGNNPSLIEAGSFRLRLKNIHAFGMKVYPLVMNGKRRAPISVVSKDGELILVIDTGKLPDGPAIFFEIITE